jgi:O-acetylserine/cysteine efflux transporter
MSFRDAILALTVAALWGGNFVNAKYGMHYFPPFLFTILRFALVGLLLLPFLKLPTRENFRYLLMLAVLLGTGHFAFLFAGLYHGLSIPTCIIITQLGVPFSCMLGTIFFKDHLGMWRSMGMVMAFIGLMLVVGTPEIASNMTGFVFTLIGAMLWGFANVIMKKMGDVNIFQMLGWMAILSVPFLSLISYLFEENQYDLVMNAPIEAVLSVSYTALCSTMIAYGLWYSLIRKYDMSQVAPFTLLVPLFGISVGQIFYPEVLTWQVILGGVLTLSGVGIIVIRRPKNIALSRDV